MQYFVKMVAFSIGLLACVAAGLTYPRTVLVENWTNIY